jgi:flagellar protein FliO/FliZ
MRKSGASLATVLITGRLEAAALTPDPKAVPVLAQSDLVQWTMGLALVIVLILIAAWTLRRLNQFSAAHGGRLRILGGVSVGTRERVVLLQVGEKQLLLGVAPGRVETLHVLQPGELLGAEHDKPGIQASHGFASRIKQVMKDSCNE